MTVKELIKILMDCPQDAEVELSVHTLALGLKSQDISIFDGKSFALIYEGCIPMQRGTMVYSEDGKSFVLIYEGCIPMQRGTMVYSEDGEE